MTSSPKPLLLALAIVVMMALVVMPVTAIVVNPGAGYFVIHNSQHHGEHYEPSGYTVPKAVSDNLAVFIFVCLFGGPLTLFGLFLSQGNPLAMMVILILILVVFIGYVFPTTDLMIKATMRESCIPNTAFNTTCGGVSP